MARRRCSMRRHPLFLVLREMAVAGDDAPVAALTFWTPHGAQKVHARIHFPSAGPQTLAVVTASPETDAPRAHASVGNTGDDGATLKDIARRLREGSSADDHPVGDHDSAPPDAARLATLVATLAHELKTPLAAISAASEIMKDERFGPLGNARYAGYAADIHGSALHILRLVDRLLDRGASGDRLAGLEFVQLDMRRVLDDLLSQMTPLADDAGVALVLDAARELPHLIADVTSVRQIVLNLFSNALRHTGRGGAITVSAQMQAGGTFEIAMSDTGSGMTRADVNRILRAAASGKLGATAGRGIGLPLVSSLAKANGADFALDSSPGGGTSASVVFGRDRVVPV